MKAAAALSEHPLATQAVGEVVGSVLETMGTPPDLAVLVVSGTHRGTIDDVTRAVRRLVNPRVLIGVCDVGVAGSTTETADAPAISLWAAAFGVDITPVRLQATRLDESVSFVGGAPLSDRPGTLVTLAEGSTFPLGVFLDELSVVAPSLAVAGGLASVAAPPSLLMLDDEIFADGAVGAWLPPEVRTRVVTAQATRPFGEPLTVTRAQSNVAYELAGKKALSALNEQINVLDEADRILLGRGLHVGLAIDEHRQHLSADDFLVRRVLGADRRQGALQFGGPVSVGQTVHFHLRDPIWAGSELRRQLGSTMHPAALAFSSADRGASLFGIAGHDHSAVSNRAAATAGMICGGEISSLGSSNRVDETSVSVLLFEEPGGQESGSAGRD